MSITARGGYQIVDFKNAIVPIHASGEDTDVVNVPGIYAAFSGLKPIQCNNLRFSGSENIYQYPTYVFPTFVPDTHDYYFDIEIVLEYVKIIVFVRPNDDVFARIAPQGE